MHTHRRSLIELNVGVFLLSLVPLFVKLVPLNAVSLIFWRAVFGAAALGLLLHFLRQPIRLAGRREYLAAVVVSVLMCVHWVTYFQSIKVSTVAIGLTAIFTYPALTVLIEPLVFGERPRALDLLLAVVALIGVALIVPGLSLDDGALQGVLWGVFSALLFALRNVLYRRWLRHVSGWQIMFYQLLVVVVMLALFIEPVSAIGARDWGLLALLGVVFTATAHSLFVGSMRQLRAKTASLVACVQPVYGIAAAWWLLSETPGGRTLLGAAIVVAVAVVESLRGPTGPGSSATAPPIR